MGLFSLGKRSGTILLVVTHEGAGRLRLNGFRTSKERPRAAAVAHGRTVCWIEYDATGLPIDRGIGVATLPRDETQRVLAGLPTDPIGRAVLDRLRAGEESVSKWLRATEATAR